MALGRRMRGGGDCGGASLPAQQAFLGAQLPAALWAIYNRWLWRRAVKRNLETLRNTAGSGNI
jgi:hypothetical protein